MSIIFRLLLLLSVFAVSHQSICGEEGRTFCWWAIDIIAVSENFNLFYNGRSEMIENNIKELCNATNQSHYGISFVDVTMYFEDQFINNLAEVSYYCCNNCTQYKKYSKKQVIEDLLDNYYKKRLEPLADTDRHCFNTFDDKVKNIVDNAPCIFVLNANSLMKVYSGPMLWNNIDIFVLYPRDDFNTIIEMFRNGRACNKNDNGIGDGQCLKLEAEEAYFIFCCCWSNPFDCTYDSRIKVDIEKNKQIWLELAQTRNPEIALRMEAIYFGNKDIQWSYHDFIYSSPKNSSRKDIVPGLNEPRYYCSRLISYTSSDHLIPTSVTWKRLKVNELPLRYRFCKFTISLHFQNDKAKRIQYSVRPDFKKKCKKAQCTHESPKCLTDVLRAKTVLIRSTCCCASNLCSTWTEYVDYEELNVKSKYFTTLFGSCFHQSTTYLRSALASPDECVRNFDFRFREEIFINEHNLITYIFAHKTVAITDNTTDDRRKLSCAIYQTYPLRDPYCHLKKNYESERSILQYYNCKCDVTKTASKLEKCDAEINSELLLTSLNWTRPTCFFTSITDHRSIFPSEKQTGLSEGSEEETEETPICGIAIIISNSGLFYRFYKSRYSHFQEEVASKKRFFVTKWNNHTTYTILCQSNETIPCNNIQNLMLHHLSYSLRHHSKTKKPQPYHRCVVSEKTKTRIEKCSSTSGCFTFSYLNSREKLTGCVDKIPALVEISPDLSPLLWCLQKTYHNSKYRCRAYKTITNVTASGTLCCCFKDCFIMTDEEYGFNPFESVL
ncbi:hypothetical protein ACH3XW_21625 [Acanthocheilonema viteae]